MFPDIDYTKKLRPWQRMQQNGNKIDITLRAFSDPHKYRMHDNNEAGVILLVVLILFITITISSSCI